MLDVLFAANVREATQDQLHRWLDQMPAWVREIRVLGLFPWQWLGLVMLLAGAVLLGTLLQRLASAVISRVARQAHLEEENTFVNTSPGPLRGALTVVL